MNAKELKSKLSAEYPYRIELHAHTKPQSKCGELAPSELAELYAKKGYDGIVVTNHFMGSDYMNGAGKDSKIEEYLRGFYETRSAGEKFGIRAYLGIEIRFAKENDNDYLIFGADEDVVSRCYDFLEGNFSDFRKNLHLEKSVIVQAHPFRDGVDRADAKLLDGVETFNMHPGHNGRIGFAARFAKDNDIKIQTCGSDFHHRGLNHEAVAALRTRILPEDSFAIAEILKSGDYLFEIGENSLVLP